MNLVEVGNSFRLDFKYKDKRHRPTIPGLRANIKSHRKTAESIQIQIEADIARNDLDLTKYFPDYKNAGLYRSNKLIKIEELLTNYLNQKHREVEATTFKSYKNAIEYHLIPEFGDYPISALKPSHIREWIGTLDICNKTINNILIPLRAVSMQAFHEDIIPSDPLSRIKSLPPKSEKRKPLKREDMEKILTACSGQIHNVFKFAFWTGLRTSEYIALKWDSVNLEDRTVFVHEVRTSSGDKRSTKTSSGTRLITLNDLALEALVNQKEYSNSGHVFINPRTGQPWKDDQAIRKTAWKPALKKAGIEYQVPYTTSHTFISILLSLGANVMWVAEQVGHSDFISIRKNYASYIPDANVSEESINSIIKSQYGHKGDLSD